MEKSVAEYRQEISREFGKLEKTMEEVNAIQNSEEMKKADEIAKDWMKDLNQRGKIPNKDKSERVEDQTGTNNKN